VVWVWRSGYDFSANLSFCASTLVRNGVVGVDGPSSCLASSPCADALDSAMVKVSASAASQMRCPSRSACARSVARLGRAGRAACLEQVLEPSLSPRPIAPTSQVLEQALSPASEGEVGADRKRVTLLAQARAATLALAHRLSPHTQHEPVCS
jgi:hypothetical protein